MLRLAPWAGLSFIIFLAILATPFGIMAYPAITALQTIGVHAVLAIWAGWAITSIALTFMFWIIFTKF